MAHLVRLYQAHCHISLPLAAAAKAATVSVSVSVWVPFLISLPDFPFFAIDSCQFSVLCFKCATRSLWHPPSPPSGGWVGGKVPFLHSSSSSGFKHSTLCCSFDTMSNNHEFYLDHKKKNTGCRRTSGQAGGRSVPGGRGGKTGPRRRPSTLNKCFSFLSSLCCLYVCLPFLRCCFFFYFFFCCPFLFYFFIMRQL